MAGRGGKREGAGRPAKADEERIRTLTISSLIKTFGSEQAAFDNIAKQAKDSFPHLKLLLEYAYGKPKEYKEVELTDLRRKIGYGDNNQSESI